MKINLNLARGKHLLLTPGVYQLDAPLLITHRNTVVLGLGMPSLTPDRGTPAMLIADADGVRIGGPWLGKAKTTLVINSDHTIVDNVWAWRADHGNGVGWTQNTADTRVIVAGDDVIAYGLFVEHFQKYQTIWSGERGQAIFYQSELPYDPPSQAAWSSPTIKGWASYPVAPGIRHHTAAGLGAYSFFNQNVDIRADRAIEVPTTPGVQFTHMVTVFLNGSGGIEHTVNDAGVPEIGVFGTSFVANYP